MSAPSAYQACAHIRREKPNVDIDEDVAKAIGSDYRVLPLFEKGMYEYTYRKHYSLQTNELLKCRWKEYKKNFENRVFAPFEFVDIRDYHFYLCRNRLIPCETIHKKNSFRFKLKPGPGVDLQGQMPIPEELFMKRGEGKKEQSKKPTAKKPAANKPAAKKPEAKKPEAKMLENKKPTK